MNVSGLWLSAQSLLVSLIVAEAVVAVAVGVGVDTAETSMLMQFWVLGSKAEGS